MADLWIANLADGSTKEEEWLEGHLSPWQRLMEYCKKQNTYVISLRLTMGGETVGCPDNAKGYWQSHAMPTVQGIKCDEELHKWRGVGWVEGEDVNIVWGARDPKTHQTVFWRDLRPAKNQAQIIWAPTQSLFIPDAKGNTPVRNIKKFTKRIVEDANK